LWYYDVMVSHRESKETRYGIVVLRRHGKPP